jgi:hypothetical protein
LPLSGVFTGELDEFADEFVDGLAAAFPAI